MKPPPEGVSGGKNAESDPLYMIEQSAKEIIKDYPLAAGLTCVSEVINHLDLPKSFPASLWPPPNATSSMSPTAYLQFGLMEPQFDSYEREIALLLSQETKGPTGAESSENNSRWKREQEDRFTEAMQEDVEKLRQSSASQGNYGGFHYPKTMFQLPSRNDGVLLSSPASAVDQSDYPSVRPSSVLDHILNYPHPPPESSLATHHQSFVKTSQKEKRKDASEFFDTFLRPSAGPIATKVYPATGGSHLLSQQSLQQTSKQPSSLPNRPIAHHPVLPESSPDPLRIGAPSPSIVAPTMRKQLSATFNGVRYPSKASEATNGLVEDHAMKKRKLPQLATNQPRKRTPILNSESFDRGDLYHNGFSNLSSPLTSPLEAQSQSQHQISNQSSLSQNGGNPERTIPAEFPSTKAHSGAKGIKIVGKMSENGISLSPFDSSPIPVLNDDDDDDENKKKLKIKKKSSAKITQNQDIIDKFTDLTSDIFAADDSQVEDTSTSHLQHHHHHQQNSDISNEKNAEDFTSPTKKPTFHNSNSSLSLFETVDGFLLLQSEVLKTLCRNTEVVKSKDRSGDLLEEMEEGGMTRLLKILGRSWRVVEDLMYWPREASTTRLLDTPPSAAKRELPGAAVGGKKGGKSFKRRPGSASPIVSKQNGRGRSYSVATAATGQKSDLEDDDQYVPSRGRSVSAAVHDTEDGGRHFDEETLNKFSNSMNNLSDALLAIRTATTLLTVGRLPKNFYSPDYIMSILAALRHVTDEFLFPLLEAASDSPLFQLHDDEYTAEICGIAASFESAVSGFIQVVQQESMSEDIVISAVYLSISPFFHDAPSDSVRQRTAPTSTSHGGKALERSMQNLQIICLRLLKILHATYPKQNDWIVEELLANLSKLEGKKGARGTIRLRTNIAIQPISNLILHLLQCCPVDVSSQVKTALASDVGKIEDAQESEEQVKIRGDSGLEEGRASSRAVEIASVSQTVLEPIYDSAHRSARTIVNYLLQKACRAGKAVTGSIESEYKIIFDNLVTDTLATLHLPEWPAASMLLMVCCKSFLAGLSDSKATGDVNAWKAIALDHAGLIGTRLKGFRSSQNLSDSEQSFTSVLHCGDVLAFNPLIETQQKLIKYLVRKEQTDVLFQGTASFIYMLFTRNLCSALELADDLLGKAPNTKEAERIEQIRNKIEQVSLEGMVTTGNDVPGLSSSCDEVDDLVFSLNQYQPLSSLYQPLLDRVLNLSESAIVNFRTKALRAISLLIAQDHTLFLLPDVRKSIESRMLDSSPAVRDAAIELVGKYVLNSPELAEGFLPVIKERITDTALSVRRRVIKLLKSLYMIIPRADMKAEICRKLLWRVRDEDDGIRDLSVDAIEELWFPRTASTTQSADKEASSKMVENRAETQRLAAIIMSVATDAGPQTRPPPIDEVLRHIYGRHADKGSSPPVERLRAVVESLIDGLVEDEGSLNVINCIKTVYLINAADPTLLSTAKCTILLPFLKSATTPEEQVVCDYLLKIFRAAVTALPKTASKFAKDLQNALLPMLNKPVYSSSGTATLQEIVACFCAVIRGQTHDFNKLVTVFRACAGRLITEMRKLQNPSTTPNTRSLPILCYLTSLLCEHGDLDSIRLEYPDMKELIDGIIPTSVSKYVYGFLAKLYTLPIGVGLHSAVLTSFGFLYRAFPTFMLLPESTAMMDKILDSDDGPNRLHLFRILQDFLGSQGQETIQASNNVAQTPVNIDELVGNVENFADSGVASAICQRHIRHIVSASLSLDQPLQRVASDILFIVARSGYSHPLAISPTIVALTASSDLALAGKAYSTLASMHQKHATLLATRFYEPAKASYSYMASIAKDEIVHGYLGDPLSSNFGRWYGLLQKEKRHLQLDYLKTLSRTFELEPGKPCSLIDISFARYIAEALSSLEFKRNEEPMVIIYHLNAILAVAGLQVLHLLEQSVGGGKGILIDVTPSSSPSKAQFPQEAPVHNGSESSLSDLSSVGSLSLDLARQSVICGMALLLRDHLKYVYAITDVRMEKYVVGKRSTYGDRSVVRRADAPLALGLDDYVRMPFTVNDMVDEEDCCSQRDTFITMIQQDGTIGALDELQVEFDDEFCP